MRKLRKALYVASFRSLFGFPSRAVFFLVKGKFSAPPGIFCFPESQEAGTFIESGWVSVAPPSVQIELPPDEFGHKWKVVQLQSALQFDRQQSRLFAAKSQTSIGAPDS
jgi:hypothetical protein